LYRLWGTGAERHFDSVLLALADIRDGHVIAGSLRVDGVLELVRGNERFRRTSRRWAARQPVWGQFQTNGRTPYPPFVPKRVPEGSSTAVRRVSNVRSSERTLGEASHRDDVPPCGQHAKERG
jgi:hypothetical protein